MGDQRPFYFFKENSPDGSGYLSQFYPSRFKDETGRVFLHAEQYMMYHKALTFQDTATAKEILLTSKPAECKALGSSTKSFRDDVWDGIKFDIVTQGSYLKFTNGVGEDAEELKELLLATGERELVEASPFDRVWGVGYNERRLRQGKKGGVVGEMWGQNLLGKALMVARKRIREEEAARAVEAGEEVPEEAA